MRLVQDSTEQIWRCGVYHGEEITERLSHPLVGKPVCVQSPRSWGAPRSERSIEGQPLIVESKREKVILRDSTQEVSK
jgi:hypothetical protein